MTDIPRKHEKRDKRSNGEGAIYQRKDGRFEAKFTLPNGKRACVYGRNRSGLSPRKTRRSRRRAKASI